MSRVALALARAQETHHEMMLERRRSRTEPRVEPVSLPPPMMLDRGLARRPAGEVPVNGRPVVVLRPVPDDAQSVTEFVLDQFTPPARRLAR